MQHDGDGYDILPPDPPKTAERPHTQRMHQPQRLVQCPNCKYDLRGSAGERCPECGTRITEAARRRADQTKRNFFREVYLEPLIYIAVGLTITVLASYFTFGVGAVIGMLMLLGILSVAGWVIFFVMSLLWIGFDQPIHVTMISLTAAYSGAVATMSIMNMITPCFALIVAGIVLVGLLMHLLEIDRMEAVLTAILSWGVLVALVMTVF